MVKAFKQISQLPLIELNHAVIFVPGHKACVQLLLDEGADIEQRNVVHNLLHPCCPRHPISCLYMLKR